MVRSCKVDECDRLPVKRGWCDMHYRRQLRTGEVGPAAPKRLPAYSPCRYDGCDQPNEGRGMCHRHYQQWWAGTAAGIRSRPSSNHGSIQRPFSLEAMGDTVHPWLFYLTEWHDPTADEAIGAACEELEPLEWDLLREAS